MQTALPHASQRPQQVGRIVATLALAGLIILALLLGLAPGRPHTALADSLQTVGHFGFFALFAMVATRAAGLLPPQIARNRGIQYMIGLGVAVIAGSMLELAQKFIPLRTASWNDLGQDSLGAVAGIALIMVWRGRHATTVGERRLACIAWLALAAAIFVGSKPFAACARDYWLRNSAYPRLLEIGQVWTHRFLSYETDVQLLDELPADWPSHVPRNAVTVVIHHDQGSSFPGISLKEPYPDWRGQSALAFDVLNPGPSTRTAVLRVHDFQHSNDYDDRFNRSLELEPGFQTVRIPLEDIQHGPRDRPLDLSHVAGLKLFVIRPTETIRLVIGNFRLE